MGHHLGILLLEGITEDATKAKGGGPMEIVGGAAVLILLFWLRGRFYRNRFRRALKAMNRGGAAERAKWAFWKAVAACVFFIFIWAYMKDHAR